MSENILESTKQTPTPEVTAEFDWLMSLALDDQLDESDRARFEMLLVDYDELAETWSAWQWIDSEFDATPALTPPSGFVQRFDLRLAEQEQQRQQRVLLLSATLALAAIVIVFVSTASVGAFVFLTQGQWVGEQLRALALAYTSANLWFGSSLDMLVTLTNTPQAQVVGGAYVLMLVVLLTIWVQLVRSSGRLSEVVSVQVE